MLHIVHIYCYWTWIFTLLFFLNLTPYSPLLSLIGAFIFTVFNNILFVYGHISLRLFIIIWEFLLILLVLTKTTRLDIKFNIMLFFTYYLFLLLNKLSFYEVYFVLMPKYSNYKTTAKGFIKKRINYFKNYFQETFILN